MRNLFMRTKYLVLGGAFMFWTTDFLNNATIAAASMIKSFEYEIGDSWKTANIITSGREGNGNIYSYFMLEIPADVSGTITGFRALGIDGKVVGSKTDNITKSDGTAMIYKFKIRIHEEGK